MGEIADMVLEGLMCPVCGEMLDIEDEVGYPVACSTCAQDSDYTSIEEL